MKLTKDFLEGNSIIYINKVRNSYNVGKYYYRYYVEGKKLQYLITYENIWLPSKIYYTTVSLERDIDEFQYEYEYIPNEEWPVHLLAIIDKVL